MTILQPFARVYGIYPCLGGFAFALIEARGRLVDWGKLDLGNDTDDEFETRLCVELSRYAPLIVALEAGENAKRGAQAQRRVRRAMELATHLRIQCVTKPGESVRDALGLSALATKHDVARELCERFPELSDRLPKRSIWRRDPWTYVFAAVGLAWAAVSVRES